MADENTCWWPGASGKTYKYWYYPYGSALKAEPGNYIFAKQNAEGRWVPLYIGQTDDLKARVADHEKRKCALDNGCTHIHAHISSADEGIRLAEETDLRHNYSTPCNKQ